MRSSSFFWGSVPGAQPPPLVYSFWEMNVSSRGGALGLTMAALPKHVRCQRAPQASRPKRAGSLRSALAANVFRQGCRCLRLQ